MNIHQIVKSVFSFLILLKRIVFGKPILLLFHIHGDMGPNIDAKMKKTADNGGQTIFDYNIALVAARAGYEVIILNYGKFRGPDVDVEKMEVCYKNRFFSFLLPKPELQFVYVAADGFGRFRNYRKVFLELASLVLCNSCSDMKDQFLFLVKNYMISAQYDDGVAKERLWPYLPSIARQFVDWLHRQNLVNRLKKGKSLIYGGYADAAYTAVLVKYLLGLDEKVLPVSYVTHSVAIGETGKASVVMKPFLESGQLNASDFYKKMVECAFYPRIFVEKSALLLMTCVAATSPEHFSNMPYLQQEIRKAFAVPGINQDRVMPWEKQLKKNPKLQKYFGLNPRDAAEAFLKDERLPIDKILIFFPVRLQEVKNLHNAILALKCLDDRFCLLITAGPQPSGRDRQEQAYWDRLSSIIGENSLNCILRPGTDKVNEYFAAIASLKGIGASVARFEPFGMVPQESLGNGAPVVVGNVAGCVTSGYLRDRETALAVNPYDPEDIARAIHGLASDEALYQSIQKNGLRLAQATTWETTFSKAVYGAEMVRKLVKSGKIKSVEAQFPEEHIKILSLAGFVAGQVLLPDEEWIHNQDIIQEIMESTREKS